MNAKQRVRVLIHINRIRAEKDMIRQIIKSETEADLVLEAIASDGEICPNCLGGVCGNSMCPRCGGLGTIRELDVNLAGS